MSQETKPASTPSPERKPWPMSGVVIAIVICLAGYTYVRLKYAKEDHGHEPFAKAYARRESEKLKAAGWVRFDAQWERDVEVPPANAPMQFGDARAPLWEELFKASTENFHLPIDFTRVSAPARIAVAEPLVVNFEAEIDGARVRIHSFDVYHKAGDLVFVPRWEQIPSEMVPADLKSRGRITLPAGKLAAGKYHVRLQALKRSSEFDVEVTP